MLEGMDTYIFRTQWDEEETETEWMKNDDDEIDTDDVVQLMWLYRHAYLLYSQYSVIYG